MLGKLVPPFVIDYKIMLNILRHRNESRMAIQETDSKKNAIIIGNGPSLNETVKESLQVLQENDCFMVNQSAVSDYFEQIRPRYYFTVDPFYFVQKEKNKNIPALLEAFSTKLTWDMTLFAPYEERDSYIVNEYRKHPRITLIFLNSIPFVGTERLNEKKWFNYWNQNIMGPLSQTVLNTALSVAITMKYKNIYLIGADTSWIEMLRVDQSNNDLYTEEKHFYNIEKRMLFAYNEERSNLAAELESIKRTFEYYQILKRYAAYNGCKIYNASSYSLIDCLERKKL